MERVEGDEREKRNLAHLGDIAVEAVVELGRGNLKLSEALTLRPGSVIPLNILAGGRFSIQVNRAPLGEGDIAVVSERMTYRITRLVPTESQEGRR